MPILPTNAVVLRGVNVLQASLTSFEWTASSDLQDATDFGDAGKAWAPGVRSSELSLEGFFDSTAGSLDPLFSADLGAAAAVALSICPDGDGAVGKRAYLGAARLAEYTVSGSLGELVGLSTSWSSEDRVGAGVVLADRVARTASGTGPSVDNGAATTNGAVAALHVVAASGTAPTLTVSVQHSADNVTFADLVTFTALGAAGSEVKTVVGTVNRYVRASWTIGGTTPSFTFVVTFAR